jgi:hypothetical protein
MFPVLGRAALIGLIGVVACGCSAGHMVEHYGSAAAANVETPCGGGYHVYDKKAGTMLVSPYPGNSLYRAACGTVQGAGAATGAIAFQEAAEQHLTNTNRRDCTITGGAEIGPLHSEFTYACPPPRAAATSG